MTNAEKVYPLVLVFASGEDGQPGYRIISPADYDELPENFRGYVHQNVTARQPLALLGTPQTEHRAMPKNN